MGVGVCQIIDIIVVEASYKIRSKSQSDGDDFIINVVCDFEYCS